MKNTTYIFFIVPILLLSVSCNRKLYTKNKIYLDDGAELLQSFQAYFDPESNDNFKIDFFQSHSKNRVCCGKERINSYNNRKTITRYIDPWESLSQDEKEFFALLHSKTKEASNAETLYYKLNKYWLILHQMAHGYGKEENVVLPQELFGWETEKIIDEKVLLFLAENQLLKEFKDFEKFVNNTNQTVRDFINSEIEIKRLDKSMTTPTTYIQLMYIRSKSMLNVYETIRTQN